jgi:hypothetical protein
MPTNADAQKTTVTRAAIAAAIQAETLRRRDLFDRYAIGR